MRTRTRIILAGLALGAALAGGVAWATIPADNGLYTACKLKATGTIRLIDPAGPSSSLLSHCTSQRDADHLEPEGTERRSRATAGEPAPTASAGKDGAAGIATGRDRRQGRHRATAGPADGAEGRQGRCRCPKVRAGAERPAWARPVSDGQPGGHQVAAQAPSGPGRRQCGADQRRAWSDATVPCTASLLLLKDGCAFYATPRGTSVAERLTLQRSRGIPRPRRCDLAIGLSEPRHVPAPSQATGDGLGELRRHDLDSSSGVLPDCLALTHADLGVVLLPASRRRR